ncbi:methyl-accepting chemotaxis protein [Chromatium okenii]|jgi:methyl-accepting chemotaxis protein|uniref:Methyl-accepting chemotaxis protein n=1 Tax=Chromatium okenii TaxID=61644 RepID=A0A2S7XSC1_9GAMM|nr:methyl-accepting chemotaxis protein [Chromatium okenii]PQJ96536.1 methyl-accepting chemotaxis protein [Chromatium okenii]
MLNRLPMVRKLLFTLVPLTVVMLLGTALLARVLVQETATANALESTRQLARIEGERMVSHLTEDLASIKALVSVVETRAQIPESNRRDYFNQILERYLADHPQLLAAWTGWEPNAFDGRDAQFVGTAGHDASGRYVPYWYRNGSKIALEPLVDYDTPGAGDYYLLAKQTRKPVILEPYLYPVGGVTKLITSIVAPVIENGRFIGVVGVDLLIASLQEEAKQIKILNGTFAFFSHGGTVIAHPDSTRLGRNMRETESDVLGEDLPRFIAAVANAQPFMTQRESSLYPSKTLIISEPIALGDTGKSWSIAMALPMNEVLKVLTTLMQQMLFISIAGLVLMIALIWLLSRSIAHPLREVVAVLEDIASGEGDLTRQLPVQGNDEITHLASAFNRFVDKIHTLVRQTTDAVTQLTTAAAHLSDGSEEAKAQVERQRTETEQVATAMHEMTATVQEVSRNANSAAHAARDANQEAGKGERIVQNTVAAIEALARDIDAAAEVIRRLETDSDTIGKVLDVIRSIAEQTNLLALNAAIEAARAGEQGRGFAVVADEVRTLASRTQESTKEIQTMIERLQAGAESAVTAMQQSRSRSVETVAQAGQAGAALNSIATAIVRIDDMNTQIASAAEEQSAVAEEINRNVNNITQSVEMTAQGSRTIANSSEQLAQLANGLQARLRQFRI